VRRGSTRVELEFRKSRRPSSNAPGEAMLAESNSHVRFGGRMHALLRHP